MVLSLLYAIFVQKVLMIEEILKLILEFILEKDLLNVVFVIELLKQKDN
jgi:hypothetical protein